MYSYKSISEINENDVTDFTDNGKCSNCGSCCSGFLPLSYKEIERIRRYVNSHNLDEHINILPLSTSDFVIDITCPFRDNKNNKCDIYQVRPSICKSFICSMNKEDIIKNKNEHHKYRKLYDLRKLFFK